MNVLCLLFCLISVSDSFPLDESLTRLHIKDFINDKVHVSIMEDSLPTYTQEKNSLKNTLTSVPLSIEEEINVVEEPLINIRTETDFINSSNDEVLTGSGFESPSQEFSNTNSNSVSTSHQVPETSFELPAYKHTNQQHLVNQLSTSVLEMKENSNREELSNPSEDSFFEIPEIRPRQEGILIESEDNVNSEFKSLDFTNTENSEGRSVVVSQNEPNFELPTYQRKPVFEAGKLLEGDKCDFNSGEGEKIQLENIKTEESIFHQESKFEIMEQGILGEEEKERMRIESNPNDVLSSNDEFQQFSFITDNNSNDFESKHLESMSQFSNSVGSTNDDDEFGILNSAPTEKNSLSPESPPLTPSDGSDGEFNKLLMDIFGSN